ncbi:MAG: hypothetical protein E7152_15560 [Enterococcus casseliflavus]|nr:hypothetical protein [Enterococcus casseliflavus]
METITLTTEELSQRIAEEVEKQLAEQKKPKINYGLKFSKEVEAWLEKQRDNRRKIYNQKTAIYEAVKACLDINRMSDLSEENYHLAVNVFDQQKMFFRKRVFPSEQGV